MFFQPTGRYSGNCQRLDILVEGEWPICFLSLPAFNPISLPPLLISTIDRSLLRSALNIEFHPKVSTTLDRK
jgi:hypothetical protein